MPSSKSALLSFTKHSSWKFFKLSNANENQNKTSQPEDCPATIMADSNKNNLVVRFCRILDSQITQPPHHKSSVTTTRPMNDCDSAQTTKTKKATIPIPPAGSSEHQIICCLQEFQHAQEQLQWTTGAKLFEAIKDVLRDPSDRHQWDGVCANDKFWSVTTFDAFIKTLIKNCINCEFADCMKACRVHQRFLNNVKKTRTLTFHKFVALLQHHDETTLPRLCRAPDAQASCNGNEIKGMVFNSKPEAWCNGCDLCRDPDKADLDLLTTCVEKQDATSEQGSGVRVMVGLLAA